MLRLALDSLRDGPFEWEEAIDAPSIAWPDLSLRFAGPALLRARAEAAGNGCVHLTGGVVVRLALDCRRCLEPLEQELAVEFDLLFREGADRADANGGLWPLERGTAEVDLRPALREEISLATPEFPVCRTECKGLCPRCGGPQGEDPCDCEPEATDPRWDALRSLQEG